MSEMVNVNTQKLTDNLVEIAAMAQELEEYIIGNEVYRTVLVSVAGNHRKLQMSGGDLLARLNQLKDSREKLPQTQQDQLKTVEATVQRTIYSLRTRFHELLRRELKSRRDQLNWNITERLGHADQDPDVAEIGNRQRIAAIQQELSNSTM